MISINDRQNHELQVDVQSSASSLKEMSFNTSRTTLVDEGSLHVHFGDPTSTSVTLGNTPSQESATTDNQRTQKKYDRCPSTLCLQTDTEGNECLGYLNCAEVPAHFRDFHGIKNLDRNHLLACNWQRCGSQVIRHNFVRHIRECHLKHDRILGHENQVLICSVE